MNDVKTLRFKTAIGALAIILGLWRFSSGMRSILALQELKAAIAKNLYPLKLDDMKSIATITTVYLPIALLLVFGIFVAGVCLLCVDKGVAVTEPREKSRKWATAVCALAITHALGELVYYCCWPQSYKHWTPEMTMGLVWVAGLVVLCLLGLRAIPAPRPVKQPAPVAAPDVVTPATITLDAEIVQLKKEIEKRRLEKELAALGDSEKTT